MSEKITLSAKQLVEAAYWANVDNDPDVDDEEVVIEYIPARKSIDGEDMQAGEYLYYVECPEEGVIGPLGSDGGFEGRLIVIEENKHKQLQAKNDELVARVARLEEAALIAIHALAGGQAKADVRDIYDETESESLAHMEDLKNEKL